MYTSNDNTMQNIVVAVFTVGQHFKSQYVLSLRICLNLNQIYVNKII